MTWLAQNWIWVLFGIAFVAMHLFGHGGHGGHGGHSSQSSGRGDASETKPARTDDARPAAPPASSGPHHH
jgi:hypothetical protein